MAQKHGGKKVRGVFYRRGTWWCRWFEHGRARVEACDSKTQASIRYGFHRAQVREGIFFPKKFAAKAITVSAWMKRCVEGSTNIGKGNEARYCRRWCLYLGTRLLSAVSTEDLRHIQAKMRAALKPHAKTKQLERRWSDATINRHFAFIRHCCSLAVKDNKITRNPVSGVTFFPEQNRTRFLSEDELRRLHGVMKSEDWNLVALAIESGLRQSEMFGLRWDCVDIENGVLTIPLSKSGKTRHVPMSQEARRIVRSFDSFLHSPFVFPSVHNPLKSLCPDSFLRNIFRPALRKAGIQNCVWHSLRHTSASRRVAAGADLYAVKEFLGHADYETTLKYSHLSPKHLRDTANLGSLGGLLPTVAKTVAEREGPAVGSVQPVDCVVRPEGLEPPTPRSVVWCSIH